MCKMVLKATFAGTLKIAFGKSFLRIQNRGVEIKGNEEYCDWDDMPFVEMEGYLDSGDVEDKVLEMSSDWEKDTHFVVFLAY